MHRLMTLDLLTNLLFWLFLLTGFLLGFWLANRRFGHSGRGIPMSLLGGGIAGGILGGLLFFLGSLFFPWLGGGELGIFTFNLLTSPLLCLFPLIGLFFGWWLLNSKYGSLEKETPTPLLLIYCGWGIVIGILGSIFLSLCFLLVGIGGGGGATPTPTPATISIMTSTPSKIITPTLTMSPTLPTPTVTLTNTPTPTATLRAASIPTPTFTPTPTATLLPAEAIEITDVLAADGCPIVELNLESWMPPHALYNEGSDPFFHIYSNEEAFYFSVELYTQYGAGWTGQLGTFTPNCNGNGICLYLVPDAVNPYLATEGEVEIIALPDMESDVITDTTTIEIGLTNLTFQPVPGSNSTGCFHINDTFFNLVLDKAEPD